MNFINEFLVQTDAKCLLCGAQAKTSGTKYGRQGKGNFYYYSCEICGNFGVEDLLLEHDTGNWNLTSENNIKARYITQKAKEKKEAVLFEYPGFEEQIKLLKFPQDPLQAADEILLWIQERMSAQDDEIYIDFTIVFPLFLARTAHELYYWLQVATDKLNYLDQEAIGYYSPSVYGWNRLRELHQSSNKISKSVFVAMWFDPSMNEIFEKGIEPALTAKGYSPIYLARNPENKLIDDQIIAGIRKSKFIIADFTGHRNGVYYEAGFAAALGIDVIHTCREGEEKDRHFDIEHHPFTYWKTAEELKEKLINRIEATIL